MNNTDETMEPSQPEPPADQPPQGAEAQPQSEQAQPEQSGEAVRPKLINPPIQPTQQEIDEYRALYSWRKLKRGAAEGRCTILVIFYIRVFLFS